MGRMSIEKSTKVEKIIYRLMNALNFRSFKEVAEYLGENEKTISAWKTRDTKSAIEKIIYRSRGNVYTKWLLTGEGPILITTNQESFMTQDKLRELFKFDREIIDIEGGNEGRIFPVVKTYDDENTQLHFYCIHCRTWHHHGRGGKDMPFQEGRGYYAGHRHAHCFTINSPYGLGGIILHVVGRFNAEIRKQYRKEKILICPQCRNYYSAAFNACKCGFINKERKSKQPEMARLYQEYLKITSSVDQENMDNWVVGTHVGKQHEVNKPEVDRRVISIGRRDTDLPAMSTQARRAVVALLEVEQRDPDGFLILAGKIIEMQRAIPSQEEFKKNQGS